MFIDDSTTDLVLYGAMLRNMNYDVILISNPNLAMCQIKELVPDVIFLDITFKQGTTGMSLLKDIRKSGYNGTVCMLSGHSDIQTIQHTINLGADDYLIKPVYSNSLNNLIESV